MEEEKQTKANKLNLYQKLAEIKKLTEVLQKTKQGHGYKYVPEDEILAKVSLGMRKQGVSLVPRIVPQTATVTPYHTSATKLTTDNVPYEKHYNEILVQADMYWDWVDNDNPDDKISVPWILVGQQTDASQAFGSGLTYTSRFFLLKYFNIATVDSDPDNYRKNQSEIENREVAIVVKAIVDKIDGIVVEYLEKNKNKDDKDKLSDFLKTIVKINGRASNNYLAIKDADMASDVLTRLKNFCENENKESKENKNNKNKESK